MAFNWSLQTLLYCGIVVITLAVSTVATLAFEVPMIELEKLFLPSGQRKPSSVSNNRFKSNVADDEKCDQLSVISSISGEHAEHIEHDAPSGCFHNGGFDSNDDDDLQNLKKI